jgi:hypothetical protein
MAEVDSKGDGVDRLVDQHGMGGLHVGNSFQGFSLSACLCFRHGYARFKGSSGLRRCLAPGDPSQVIVFADNSKLTKRSKPQILNWRDTGGMLDHARPISASARVGNVYIQVELGELVEGGIEEGLVEVPSVSFGCDVHGQGAMRQ